ncbi:hypothetical protein [Streptomyces microflavus]|uniref:hypothetical protein n=1 Tax=Streptomyces microflavus TaxID=1919 RepID=UPI00386C4DB1|nr:hypothetical protein OG269_26125 [Streptomyces microflavus]WST14845.1 hypothetical protein OG721_13015 [Streptomyces microflavus]
MGKRKRGPASIKDSVVNRASNSAVTSAVVERKVLKGNAKPTENLVAAPRGRKNTKASPITGQFRLTAAGINQSVTVLSIEKRRAKWISAKGLESAKKTRQSPSLADRVYRRMTRTQAKAISEAMHDPNPPTRRLPPRP